MGLQRGIISEDLFAILAVMAVVTALMAFSFSSDGWDLNASRRFADFEGESGFAVVLSWFSRVKPFEKHGNP